MLWQMRNRTLNLFYFPTFGKEFKIRYLFMNIRKANHKDLPIIWGIIQQAIEQRRQDGSKQWQNGYPNEQVIYDDIVNGYALVLISNQIIIAYTALIFGIEPAYTDLIGKWLSNGDYAVIHRVAVTNDVKRKGIATQLFELIEVRCIEQNIFSIKVDTNFDNIPMLKILEKLNYTYCGEVVLMGAPRRAYEKLL